MQYPQTGPLHIQCSTSRQLLIKARPKPISGRTSYIRVRLEFLRQPQVIRTRFRAYRFGPPLHFTATSTCSRLDHSVSGLLQRTQSALLRLAFATAPDFLLNLARYNNSPVHSAKGTLSPINGLELFVSIRFQYLFHSPPGVLFTFPSRYLFTIGHQRVFSLAGWAPRIPTRLHVSRRTQDTIKSLQHFAYRAFTFSCYLFQSIQLYYKFLTLCLWSYNPNTNIGLGSFLFARHY